MADTITVERLVLEVSGAVDSAAQRLPRLLATITAAGAAAAAAVAGMTLAAAQMADDAAKNARELGIQIDQYTALAAAAEMARVPFEALRTAAVTQRRTLAEAAAGSQRAADAYRALGIDVDQAIASNATFADLLPQIAKGLGRIPSEAEAGRYRPDRAR